MRRLIGAALLASCVFAGEIGSAGALEAPMSTQTLAIQAAYNVKPSLNFACRGLRAMGAGTATGTPTGPSTWADNECANLIARPGKVVVTGNLVIAGSHGSLFISYSAVAALPLLLTIHPVGTFNVTGGTGDFVGATGQGTVRAVGSLLPPGPASAQLVGTVTLPGG